MSHQISTLITAPVHFTIDLNNNVLPLKQCLKQSRNQMIIFSLILSACPGLIASVTRRFSGSQWPGWVCDFENLGSERYLSFLIE